MKRPGNRRAARQGALRRRARARTLPPWMLDRKESTKLSLKYRRGKGEILIVSHGGKGWWDPTSDAKGDVFGLVQRLEPGDQLRSCPKAPARIRGGLSPIAFRIAERAGLRRKASDRPVAERWVDRKTVWLGSPTWRLSCREAPPSIGDPRCAASRGRRPAGRPGRQRLVCSFQRRGFRRPRRHSRGRPTKARSPAALKSLFPLAPVGSILPTTRSRRGYAGFDALSVAAISIESLRADTLYAASGGGMGAGHDRRARGAAHDHARRSRAHSSASATGRQWTGR